MRRTNLAPARRLVVPITLIAVALSLFASTGCHSPFVEATIDNQGTAPIHLIEVDYPSASFGVQNLAANARFHYRFKIQGSGALKLEFTDDRGQVHTVDGPDLRQGQEGRVTIGIGPQSQVNWQLSLTPPSS